MSGLTLPASIASGRHRKPTQNHAECLRVLAAQLAERLQTAVPSPGSTAVWVGVVESIIGKLKSVFFLTIDGSPLIWHTFRPTRWCQLWALELSVSICVFHL